MPKFADAPPAIRLLIFDLDGTLIDSKKDLAVSVNATLRHLNRPTLEDDLIFSYVGQGAPTLIRRVVGEPATEAELAAGLEFFLDYYWEHRLDHTRLYPAVLSALEQLAGAGRGRRTLAVLTNKPERISREILAGLDVLHLFQHVYGGNSFETKKPHPLGVRRLLAQAAVSPREAMIVGDSHIDIQAGAGAGIWTCGVTYGFGDMDLDGHPPHLLIDSLDELPGALDGRIGAYRRSDEARDP